MSGNTPCERCGGAKMAVSGNTRCGPLLCKLAAVDLVFNELAVEISNELAIKISNELAIKISNELVIKISNELSIRILNCEISEWNGELGSYVGSCVVLLSSLGCCVQWAAS